MDEKMNPNGFWAIATDFLPIILGQGNQLSSSVSRVTATKGVAVIPIHGVITPYNSIFTELFGGSSIERISDAVASAEKNPKVHAILYDVYSPGGSVDGINELAQQLSQVKKPTAAYVGALCASAAYWLTTSATKNIYIDPTASIGSIGVLHISYQDDESVIISSSNAPNKHLDPKTESGKSSILEQIDVIEDIFIRSVAQGRGVSTEFVKNNFGKGGLITGQKAVDNGMVSGISNFKQVLLQFSGKTMEMELSSQASDETHHQAHYQGLLAKCLAEETPVEEARKKIIALRSTFTTMKTTPVGVPVTETVPTVVAEKQYMDIVHDQVKNGATLADAMRSTAMQFPKLHEQWLEQGAPK
jgi:ClpP class serine protease